MFSQQVFIVMNSGNLNVCLQETLDESKFEGVKVENQEVKNRLEAVKTTLEPVMEGDEQIQKNESLSSSWKSWNSHSSNARLTNY